MPGPCFSYWGGGGGGKRVPAPLCGDGVSHEGVSSEGSPQAPPCPRMSPQGQKNNPWGGQTPPLQAPCQQQSLFSEPLGGERGVLPPSPSPPPSPPNRALSAAPVAKPSPHPQGSGPAPPALPQAFQGRVVFLFQEKTNCSFWWVFLFPPAPHPNT